MNDTTETMVTDDHAARIAAISRRRLRYWEDTGLIEPDVVRQISPRNVVRLYSLPSIVEAVVASELRHQGISLQHIRRIIDRLRDRGYTAPLRQLRFAVTGNVLVFELPDGTWEDSRRPYEGVLWQVLDLEQIRTRISDRLTRSRDDAGTVERRRKVQGSKPVFRGTRVPVEAVERYLAAGHSEEQILRAFPSLTSEDIAAARAAASVA